MHYLDPACKWVSLGSPVFLSPQNPTTPNSTSNSVSFHKHLITSSWQLFCVFWVKKIIFALVYVIIIFLHVHQFARKNGTTGWPHTFHLQTLFVHPIIFHILSSNMITLYWERKSFFYMRCNALPHVVFQ